MKARLVNTLPNTPGWLVEIKFDGVRALALKEGKSTRLISRAGNDFTLKYAELAKALAVVDAREGVFDGEIVALDPKGRPSFQLLQAFGTAAIRPPLKFYVFDVLNLDGRNVMGLPLHERKKLLQAVLTESDAVRLSKGFESGVTHVMDELRAHGFEGLVAKRRDSGYCPGQRNGDWVKFKWSQEQEFVIGGYTRPQGGRSGFGALLVGYYEGDRLIYSGGVGTGFDNATLMRLYRMFQTEVRATCPFANLPERRPGGGGFTAPQMRRCTWLQPRFVCQVRFAEWTRDGHLRQPSFLGLRDDKRPEDVTREQV